MLEPTMPNILLGMEGPTTPTSGGAPSGAEPAPGVRVSEYVLEEPIGEGGFGTVWRARHAVLPGKTVAIKLPRDRELIELLRRESILQHGLDHPGVLRVLGVDLDGPLPYIVQEYASGGDLASYLERQTRLAPDRALAIFHEIVTVIAAAHARGVVHLDLKPSNILLDDKGIVRVADFGLGRGLAAFTSSALRQSIRSLDSFADKRFHGGTWEYMSPEQRQVVTAKDEVVDASCIDARADVWALGIILFELLEGKRPAGRVGLRHVSAALDRVFARCWTELSGRYSDARELLVDVEKIRRKKPLPAPSTEELVDEDSAGHESSKSVDPHTAVAHPTRPVNESRVSVRDSHSDVRAVSRYSPLKSLWHRILILVPTLIIVAAVFVVWFPNRLPQKTPRATLPSTGIHIDVGALSEDEAVRLGEIRQTIEQHPQDEAGASALLNAFIAVCDDERLRDRALEWRTAIDDANVRREYDVRWKAFALDRDAYAEGLHSGLEPGSPDVYIRVYHTVDGETTRVFDSSQDIVEAWTHVWKAEAGEQAPSFRINWARDDGLRIEVRESDVLRDNTVAEYRVDGGLSILLFSGTRTSAEGHRVVFDSDFLFGD